MRKEFSYRVEDSRVTNIPQYYSRKGDKFGLFVIRRAASSDQLRVIVGETECGLWDHVSVSVYNRTPTWDEMCYIKELFFEDEEEVVQFHPPKSQYVNVHPYCLHLWRHRAGHVMPPITAV